MDSQKQAFGYVARSNRRGQFGFAVSQPASFRTQQDAAREWSAHSGFSIAKWFRDDDVHAPLDGREGFRALITALSDSDIQSVIVYSTAVFSSDSYFQGMVTQCFE